MRQLYTARSAGFCFGVARAVKLAEEALKSGPCYSLGPLIHNVDMVRSLESRGLITVSDADELPENARVIIRSHGAGREVYQKLQQKNVEIIDATCPHVTHIHKIVERASKEGSRVIIIGDANHPEVKAEAAYCEAALICENADELEKKLQKSVDLTGEKIVLVFQTTQTQQNLMQTSKIIKKECTNAEIFDTICGATSTRQEEARRLAEKCDAMVVVGGKNSANSAHLAALCREFCGNVQFIENAEELDTALLKAAATIGLTAGASAPEWIIKEVKHKMSEELELKEIIPEEPVEASVAEESVVEAPAMEESVTEEPVMEESAEKITSEPVEEVAAEETPAVEEAPTAVEAPDAEASVEKSFDEMLEEAIRTIYNGDKVICTVVAITPTEISVELGAKQSGYIPLSEFTDDPNAKLDELVKAGDKIEATAVRVNDVEGTVMLSKRRLDAAKNWVDLESSREEGGAVEGTVTEENKGGLVVNVRGVRVFVPASQSGIGRDEPMSQLVGQKVRLKITEVNRAKKRVVGSIRAVTAKERKSRADSIWNEIEPGMRYEGVIKSMTAYGAFVDIGGVDGMVHVSELSWGRVRQPSELVRVGDTLSVYVISVDKEKRRISLGHKNREENPWEKFSNTCAVGDVVKATIVKLMPFGAFAEIMPHVDGLIHISQLADRRISSCAEAVHPGDVVDVKITNIDNEKQKISLSIRALLEPEPEIPQPSEKTEEPDTFPADPEGDALVYEVSETGEATGIAPEPEEE